MVLINVFFVIFLDNRFINLSYDRIVLDFDNRLSNVIRGLLENLVYFCVVVYIWFLVVLVYIVVSGVGGFGIVLRLFFLIFLNVVLLLVSMVVGVIRVFSV